MNYIFPYLCTFAIGVLTGAGVLAIGFIAWVSKGEPDSNGDPERDSTTITK